MARYSAKLMEHFTSPRNVGRIEDPDRVGLAGTPGRGRYVVLHLRLDGDRIAEARYQSHGCGATIAAGSMLTEMIHGRTLDHCRALSADDLRQALGGLPPDKAHCATFAIAALRSALDKESE